MILVTGAAGYVGSHFVRYYLRQNPDKELVVVDDLSMGHQEALEGPYRNRVRFFAEAVSSPEIPAILRDNQVSVVVHFAANAYVGESQTQPFKYFSNNVVETLALLRSMDEAGVRSLVFSSTCATYGKPRFSPITELHPQKPINTYGSTKVMIEEALRSLALSKGLKYVILRYFNAAGADDSGDIGESHAPETHIIPLCLAAALGRAAAVNIYGNDYDTPDGTCVRDYVHVNDLAAAHIKAIELLGRDDYRGDIEESDQRGTAFNLGSASGASVLEIIAAVARVTGLSVPHKFAPRRPGDPGHLVADSSKAKAILGWQTTYDLDKIIATALAWEEKRRY